MRRFIFFAFIGIFLVKNVTPKIQNPSGLEWLFKVNNKQDEKKEEMKEEEKKEEKQTVCQSEECEKIARIMSENMDRSVDPCDNFYDYACGKWQAHNPIPEGMDSWGTFESAQINVLKQIKEIFDEGPKKSDPLAVKLAKKWYTVCMDTDGIEKYGLEPVVLTLARIGGWPLIMEPDEWNEEEYSWQKVDDQYMRLTGKNAFHDVRVVESGSNYTQKIVHINIPHLPPRSYTLLFDEYESEEKKDESDEDPSDEEKQSGEQQDSQEPGSKDDGENDDENDHKSDNNSNDDDENDNNDDDKNNQKDDDDDKNDGDESNGNDDDKDDNDDEDDDEDDNENTNEQTDDNKAKKKVSRGKKSGKFSKNKKLGHNRKMKSNVHSKKYENHKTKKEKVKRWAISTNNGEKLRVRENEKNGMKQTRRQKPKKTSQPHFSAEESNEEEEKDERKKYAEYISKVARAIAKAKGVEVSQEQISKDIQDMIQFQGKLFGITIGLGEDDDDSDDDGDDSDDDDDDDKEMEITLNDFQEWYDTKEPKTPHSTIDWTYKIREIFDEAQVLVDGDLNIKVALPVYFRNLIALLDETPSRTIVNYVHWNFLSRIIQTTTSEMRKLYNEWEGSEEDEEEMVFGLPKRSRICIEDVEMSDILAYEYVRNHFSDEIIASAKDMMDDIQKEVEYQIKKSEWMDENTKDFILAKLVNMDNFIGYPDWYRNNTIVRRYFQGLVIGNSYYENMLSYERYTKWKGLRRLHIDEKDEEEEMMMSPIMVNAFFSPDDNSVALSAADFQSPLFAYSRPQVINYGIVGSIMGHEVNHGFDDSGHLYNKNGEVVKWLAAMAEAYGKRAECFVKQFNNYTIGKNSDYKIKNYGNRTAGENIADTMGLEAAFRAYRRRERECGKTDTVLPGLEDITNDQLFFLSFATLWCESEEINSTIRKAKRDVHSTGRLRVIGSVSNSEDFAEAFKCPTGSAMNPEKKCHIWK